MQYKLIRYGHCSAVDLRYRQLTYHRLNKPHQALTL